MSDSAISVAKEFVRAINRQNVDTLAALMTTDHRFTDSLGNTVGGREAMRAGWAGYFGMVPDYSLAIEETFADGSVVVMLGMAQGTMSGQAGPAPGNRWQTPIAIRARIEDGLVAEWRVFADNEPIRALMRNS
jgi:ketosteroid isomerase-like protein